MIEIRNDTGQVIHRVDADTLVRANFGNAYLRGAKLAGLDLREANFRDADLREADLSNTDATGADFVDCKLEGADFTSARLTGISLAGVTLKCAHFPRAQLDGARLSSAKMSFANLRESSLVGAHLNGADMSFAYLDGANLSKAYIGGCNLESASIRGANLDTPYCANVRLTGAQFDETTRWPGSSLSWRLKAIGWSNLLKWFCIYPIVGLSAGCLVPPLLRENGVAVQSYIGYVAGIALAGGTIGWSIQKLTNALKCGIETCLDKRAGAVLGSGK